MARWPEQDLRQKILMDSRCFEVSSRAVRLRRVERFGETAFALMVGSPVW